MLSEDQFSGNIYPSTNSSLIEQEVSNIMFFPNSLKHGIRMMQLIEWDLRNIKTSSRKIVM